uniref:Uncharacterized protein n=1 Tax=Cannabis sativa TaxID=3483 RepID=A0A803QDC5_CANSA
MWRPYGIWRYTQGGNGKNGFNNGKRENNGNGVNNNNDSKWPKNTPEPAKQDPTARFITYNILLDMRENINNTTHSVVPYRKPYPMRKDIIK